MLCLGYVSQNITKQMQCFFLQMKLLTAEDFNLTTEVTRKSWDFPPFIADSPAAFMEVYESDLFSVGIFMIKPRKTMPFHDHPGMHGLM